MGTVPPTTLFFTVLYWIHLTPVNWQNYSSVSGRFTDVCPAGAAIKTSLCRQKGTSQLHRLSCSGFSPPVLEYARTMLEFCSPANRKIMFNTKIQVCGSNTNTRKQLGNSTDCHMSQERNNSEMLIDLEFISNQTICKTLKSNSRLCFTATESNEYGVKYSKVLSKALSGYMICKWSHTENESFIPPRV